MQKSKIEETTMKYKSYLKPTALSVALGMVFAPQADASGLVDRLIIKYKQGNGAIVYESSQNLSLLSSLAGVPLAHARFMHDGSQVIKLTQNYSDLEMMDIIKQLSLSSSIEYVEEDKLMQKSFIPNDTFYNLQWHYYEAIGGINLEAAWDVSTGLGVTIAVLDTGYRPHVDLAANIVGGYDMIDDPFVGNDGDARDADASDPGDWVVASDGCGAASDSSWHGTHVAGTVAAVTNNNAGVAGVAFDAQVVPVRVLGKCGGYTSDIADGMVWASGGTVTGVPNNPNPAQVMNLSLGGSGACSAATQTAIDTAVANGSVVVVASGNSNADVSGFNPGNCNNVISVASTDRNADRAYYSNYGSLIDIAAPGGDVTVGTGQDGVASTLNDGTTTPGADTYVYYQGTSMAAPHVAGVVGLMFQVNPAVTPAEVEAAIKSSARSFPGGSDCITTYDCGDGIIDAAAAIAAVNVGPVATLSTANDTISVCTNQGSTAFALTLADFGNSTEMTVSGCPSGGSCSYSVDPVNAPADTTNLNISSIGSITPGSYNLIATGTDSIDAGITDDLSLSFSVLAAAGNPVLSSPADNATSVATMPTLTWGAASQATSYTIEVATDVGFNNIVETVSGLNTTTYDVTTLLSGNTTYFWRVTAVNSCGNGASTVYSFTTGTEVCQVYNSSDVPKTITDSPAAGDVDSVLNIADDGTITDVNVINFTGTHTWINDLSFRLESPELSTVNLMPRRCSNEDDWDIGFDDDATNPVTSAPCPPTDGLSYQPTGSLADYDNENLNGVWTMTVNDAANLDGGSIDSWSLEICYIPTVSNTPPVANNDNSASTDEDSALASVDLTGNDTDVDGDDVEISSIDTTGTLGAVTINGDNDTVSYDPNGQFDS
ncbi:S8 family serine peptidase [Marinicella litoralis]|uniref:S8 family serine peptidase n=1 Tax=Marinicella litoralis TaxID=644220 RepID=UPI000BFEB5A6